MKKNFPPESKTFPNGNGNGNGNGNSSPAYLTGQVAPSDLLPGEGKSQSEPPLREKAVTRTRNIVNKTGNILTGIRTLLEGQGLGERWLSLQIMHMCNKGVLTAPFDAYVVKPEKKKVIGLNPSAHIISEAAKYLELRLPKECPASEVHTCGSKIALREPYEIDKIHRASRIVYAPPGDLNSLYDMMKLIDAKLHGRLIKKPLIIENSDDYWSNILKGFKAMHKNYDGMPDTPKYVDFDDFAHHHGIYITETREKSLELIKTLFPKLPKPIESPPANALLKKDAVIFVATGTKKKFTELENIFLAQGYKVRLLPIDTLVHDYVSPDETSGTYEGNTKEKLEQGIYSWNKMSAAEKIKQMNYLNEQYGLKLSEENMYILAEDSGIHFVQQGVGNDPIFNDLRSKMDPDGPFPGVETGPISGGSNGFRGFFQQAKTVFEKNGWTDRRIISTSILGLAPLRQNAHGQIKITMTSAATGSSIRFDAMPQDNVYSLDHYILPDGFDGATEKQIGMDFELFHSARAKAWMALAHEANINAQPGQTVERLKSKAFNAGIISDVETEQGNKLVGEIIKEGFGSISISPNFNKLDEIQKNIFSKADAFVLAFDPKKAQEDFWRNLYIFSSLIVGEQTRDKHILNKPIKLLNPDGAFDGLVQMVNDFHKGGTIKEHPGDLFHEVKSIDQAIDELDENRKTYLRFRPPELDKHVEGVDSDKAFNVAIFCSATNESAQFRGYAEQLAEELCKRNFGVVTGAGGMAMMGAITDKVDKLRHDGAMVEDPPHHTGATVYHLMHKEATKQGVIQKLTITPNIYDRIETMISASQVFTIMPGGTGTIQELAALAMLKQRAIDNPDDVYANTLMKNKEIVIFNPSVNIDGGKGFYDDFLKQIPKEDYKKLGIHVYDNIKETVNKIEELQKQHAQVSLAQQQDKQSKFPVQKR